MSGATASFVTFTVSGQRFTTAKDTLFKEPSSRLALLARGALPCVKDDTGAIFLDRDSKYFQLLLNYLRDGWCSMPTTAQERRELLQEVRWCQVCCSCCVPGMCSIRGVRASPKVVTDLICNPGRLLAHISNNAQCSIVPQTVPTLMFKNKHAVSAHAA